MTLTLTGVLILSGCGNATQTTENTSTSPASVNQENNQVNIETKLSVAKKVEMVTDFDLSEKDPITYYYAGKKVYVTFNSNVDSKTIDIKFDNKKSKVLMLPIVESNSGAKYADKKVIFWTKRNEAPLECEGVVVNCVESEE